MRIDLPGPGKAPPARRVRPERKRQMLEDVTHPPSAEGLTAPDAGHRHVIARHHGDPQVRAQKLRGRAHGRPPSVGRTAQRVQRRAGDRPGAVVLNQDDVGKAPQDATEFSGAFDAYGGASRVLRARRHDDRTAAASERCRNSAGQRTVLVQRKRYSRIPRGGTPDR